MSFQEVFFPQSVVVSTFKRNVSNAKDRIGCFQQDNVYIQKINLFYLHSGETVVTRKKSISNNILNYYTLHNAWFLKGRQHTVHVH